MRCCECHEVDNLFDVVEDNQLVAVEEDGIWKAKRIPRRNWYWLKVGRRIVGQVSDGSTLKCWQYGMFCNREGMLK